MNHTASKTLPLSRKEHDAVDVSVCDGDVEFLLACSDVMWMCVELQLKIDSVLQIFGETPFKQPTGGMIDTNVVSWPKAATYEVSGERKIHAYQASEKASAEFSLEALSIRSYIWSLTTTQSHKTSSNISGLTWLGIPLFAMHMDHLLKQDS